MFALVLQKNGKWHIHTDGFRSQRSPSTNIHYNSEDIYLSASDLGRKRNVKLNDSLKI